MVKNEIIKLSQTKPSAYNPHYRFVAYSQISGLHGDIVVIFGKCPIVDEYNPTIILDETKRWVAWKAIVNDKWYGDFVTVENDDEQIDQALDILYVQAKETIKELLK